MTKNITLSVPVSVLKAAKKIAAQQETTVNGLVRQYLTNLTQAKASRETWNREFLRLVEELHYQPTTRLPKRADLYDRQSLR